MIFRLRSMVRITAIKLTLFLCAPADTIANEVNLDGFFGEPGNRCEATLDFYKLEDGLRKRYSFTLGKPPNHRRKPSITIPDALMGAVGKPTTTYKDGYTEIFVPLVGIYKGLKTKGLLINAGDENGIAGSGIVFSETRLVVERAFSADHRQVEAKRDSEQSHGPWIIIEEIRGSPAVICDIST